MEGIVDVCVPQLMGGTTDVVKLIPQEMVRSRYDGANRCLARFTVFFFLYQISRTRDGNLYVRDGRCEHYTLVTVHVHAMFLRTFGPKRFDGCFAGRNAERRPL